MASSTDSASTPTERPARLFDSPAAYMTIPRLGELAVSPAGDRLVVSVTELDDQGAKFVTSLWELDTEAAAPARRLTRSSEGEAAFAFLPDGSILFTSSRPRPRGAGAPEEKEGEADRPALWMLPAAGGEPYVIATRPGGIAGVLTGRTSWSIVLAAKVAPGATEPEDDRKWWSERKAKKVSAALYDGLPVRHWDHFLGPQELHLFAATIDPGRPDAHLDLRDLTPDARQALHDCNLAITPDGSTVLVDWMVRLEAGRVRQDVVAIDHATGERRVLAAAEDGAFDYSNPVVSPDGRHVVTRRISRATVTDPAVVDLWYTDLTGSGRAQERGRSIDIGDEPYPQEVVFNSDGSGLVVAANWHGRDPLYEIALDTGEVSLLTDDGSWSSVQPAPDGSALFALRSRVDDPPRAVRLVPPSGPRRAPAGSASHEARVIDAPRSVEAVPGRVEEVTTEAADGTPLRAWLVIPECASASSPAPFALVIHGGPLGSWSSWHWRWNPWLLAARGWAVLLPDPALSTGYGQKMIQRGWGQWGGAPFRDLMALTDAALQHPEIDETRTAALGGSYGGYMANWIAGHTDRFAAIVSHASLWSLEQFQGTTDWPAYWADEWGYPDTDPEMYAKWSPDRFVDAIKTPMLVIHGDRDYRCPVSESLRLWADLTRRGITSKFLFFADENHWILQPGDAVVWYETVLAFLDEHVLGKEWRTPDLL